MNLLTGKGVQGEPVLGLSDQVLHGCPLQMEGNKLFSALVPVGDDGMVTVTNRLHESQLFLLMQLLFSDKVTIGLRPPDWLIVQSRDPEVFFDRNLGLIAEDIYGSHQGCRLISSDGKAEPKPLTLGHDGDVVKTEIHGKVDFISQIAHLVDVLPDETVGPVGNSDVAGSQLAVKPVTGSPDETHFNGNVDNGVEFTDLWE
jgi:hypothetical protein